MAAQPDKPSDAAPDVVIFNDSDKPQRLKWNERAAKGRSIGGHTATPGLSVVPAKAWPKIKDAAAKLGISEVAPDKLTAAQVAKTTDVAALERLLAGKPSAGLAKAIEAQIGKLREPAAA